MNKLELYNNIDKHLLADEKPSIYIESVSEEDVFKEHPFKYLYRQKFTEQSPKWHPEGVVWNHTLLVVDAAATLKEKSPNPRTFMWGALLHDIGKPDTTKVRKGRITSYDHDKVGAKLAEEFLREFTDDEKFIKEVVSLVRWHMQVLFVTNKMPFADVDSIRKEADITQLALLGLSDRLGRVGVDKEEEIKNIMKFVEIVKEKSVR